MSAGLRPTVAEGAVAAAAAAASKRESYAVEVVVGFGPRAEECLFFFSFALGVELRPSGILDLRA